MKALVLAAGFGTRLRPYTDYRPKPLFTLDGQTLLERTIRQVIAAGAHTVVVNTHHLAGQIQDWLASQSFPADILVRHENEILGTGGAIRNAADIWDTAPFMVVNGDIVTDIDFAATFRFHAAHEHPATLVLHDDPDFNTVTVDADGFIVDFGNRETTDADGYQKLTFTGIQVLDPVVLDFIPSQGFAHSIDAFQAMMAAGRKIKAQIVQGCQWSDLGSPDRYRLAAREIMTMAVCRALGQTNDSPPVAWTPLAGDGSDRRWYRLQGAGFSVVMVDHGIREGAPPGEADAFVNIGRHLHRRGLPVPRIIRQDPLAGLVFLEDLGDQHLQTWVASAASPTEIAALYRQIIDQLIQMSANGGEGFDPAWTWQTARYDREVIVEKECRYFIEAFVRGFCGQAVAFERIEAESHRLADGILAQTAEGFMHRDFQSRNILMAAGEPRFIDFQGGRLGPAEYDLASLLIDPYVALPMEMREALLAHFIDRYHHLTGKPREAIEALYRLCALARNLQILGAFGFLVREKNKGYFIDYIPNALESLRVNLAKVKTIALPELEGIVASLKPGV